MTAIFAVIATVITLSQAWLLYVQTRQARVTLCTELVDLWRETGDSWRIMIAIAMGGVMHFYAPMLTQEEQELVDGLRSRVDGPIRSGFAPQQLWLSDHTRTALSTIALIAELVLSGRLSPTDAYAVVGLDLARRSRPLRDVLFAKDEIWRHVDSMSAQQGARDRILALIDLMWVEAARRYDLSPWHLEQAASLKRAGSGAQARKRMRTQCRAVRGSRLTRWRLVCSLRYAERTDFGKRVPQALAARLPQGGTPTDPSHNSPN